MRKVIYTITIAAIILSGVSCESTYRPKSIGAMDEILVVMDSSKHESQTAEAIRNSFGKAIETVPAYEPLFRLIFTDFRTNDELERLKERKNVIFAAPIDEDSNVGSFIRAILSDEVEARVRQEQSFAFPIEDRWVRDQWALVLTSTSDSSLASKIESSVDPLVDNLLEREFDRRIEEVYRRGEQTVLNDSLWNRFGWKVRMQHDYVWTVDTTNVVSFRRVLSDNDRWMWAWWKDNVENIDFIDPTWINTTRDSLMEIYVRGQRENSFVTTEYNRPVKTRKMNLDDSRLTGYETLGTWRMTNDFMGGPFVNFVYHDPAADRLFMIEYGQFAPSVNKRRFVMQFRAMGRTFESDSTWTKFSDEVAGEVREQR
ncbi:MAG: DUF4837 family protein [Balneolaceae bacterium]